MAKRKKQVEYKSDKNETSHSDDFILQRARNFFKSSRDHTADWRMEAREDYDFVSGEQWSEIDQQYLRDQLRPIVTFNRIQPTVEAVAGTEVNNRQEVRYIPRTLGDSGVNEVLTEAAKWVRDECDAEDEESDAFFDTIVCGMGWTDTCLDYDNHYDSPIRIGRVDPLEMYWTPTSNKRNLSDAEEIGRRKKVLKDWAVSKWPELEDMSPSLPGTWGDVQEEESEPHVEDPRLAYKQGMEMGQDSGQARVVLFEYQWCERVPVYMVPDFTSGEILPVPPEQYNRLSKVAEAQGIPMRGVRTLKKRYFRAMFYEDYLLEAGELSTQEGFTYKCITAKRDQNRNLWYGLVRTMKDPQRWANKFFSTILHNINTSGQGIMAEVGAFENPKKANEEWGRPDKVTLLKNGAISGGKVQPKPLSPIPGMLPQMMEFSISSIRDVSGVSTELLGLADRQQPGVLEYQRKQAGITILATLFASLRKYRKEQGRVMLDFIQKYIPEGTLIRIVGNDGAKYVPLVKQPGTAKYDVIVDDAPTSPNMRERVWSILQPMLPMLLPMLPTESKLEIFRYSPLPESLVEKVAMQLSQQQPRPDPVQQALQQDGQIKMAQLQQKGEIDREKMAMQAELNREKAEQSARLDAFKAVLDMQVKQALAEMEMRMDQQRMAFESQLEIRDQNINALLRALRPDTIQ